MKHLKYEQINERVAKLIPVKKHFLGIASWTRYIRTGLGMSMKQLGLRAKLSVPTIAQIERNEALDKVTLSSLKKVAEAMDCELVYGFVPRQKLHQMRDQQAEKKAWAFIKESHLHMEIEDQAVDEKKLKKQVKLLKEKLLFSRKLWDE